jgi:hypothetical protein
MVSEVMWPQMATNVHFHVRFESAQLEKCKDVKTVALTTKYLRVNNRKSAMPDRWRHFQLVTLSKAELAIPPSYPQWKTYVTSKQFKIWQFVKSQLPGYSGQ